MNRNPRALELLPLVAVVAAPWFEDPWAVAVLAAAVGGWVVLRPARRDAAIVGIGLALALAALFASAVSESGDLPPPGEVGGSLPDAAAVGARRAYDALWSDLDARAQEAASRLRPLTAGAFELSAELRLAAFRALAERVAGDAPGRGALFLLDRDGRARAWAGEGLLHELDPEATPASGRTFRASFAAVTLIVVAPLDETPRPWRVVAARSLPNDQLPFRLEGGGNPAAWHWSLLEEGAAPPRGTLAVRAEGLPVMVLEASSAEELRSPPAQRGLHRLAWLGIAFAALAAGVLQLAALVAPPAGSIRWVGFRGAGRRFAVGWPALAAGAALGFAAGVLPVYLAALVIGLAVAVAGLVRLAVVAAGEEGPVRPAGVPAGSESPARLRGALWGAGVTVLLGGLAWGIEGSLGSLDLAATLLAPEEVVSLRLALFAAAVGLLAFAVPEEASVQTGGDRWAWGAVGLLAAAGALHDTPLAAVPLLVAGGSLAGLWLSGARRLTRAGALATLACLAALSAAGAWETSHRAHLRQRLEHELLPRMAPPTIDEQARFEQDLAGFFAAVDLRSLVPRSVLGLETQDLAFTLWKRSPLARSDALSALVVETPDGSLSTFSFGLPLDENGLLDARQGRWEEIRLPVWKDRMLEGTSALREGGQEWATARWWLDPQPGFRLRGERRLEDVEVGLLAGLPRAEQVVVGLPRPAVYALYAPEGRVLRSPWDDAPQLPVELVRGHAAKVGTPAGRSWGFPRRGTDGWEVLYLRLLSPLAALERVATHAVSNLLLLGAFTFAAMLLALPRPGFRAQLRRTFRSYSRRLIIVNTALVLLPLVSVNVLLVAAAEGRLQREQQAAGEAALSSLQRLLGDFLAQLDPGVSLQTELNNDYMTLLSRVVHHEVNLYWQSSVFVSSRSELFTAGLLPKRIPGEVYSRLALLGHELGARTNRVAETSYLELYAPFKVGGTAVGEFYFSVPLLAQQEEVARELAALRREVLLVTIVIFGLLIAVGLRLARSFSEPLMELVEGTRRIAGGASSLELAPSELELAALVEAIDDMARRLAEGRHKLLREKEVVERMVDNITSGVVSLDRDGRVLMRNRVAADLLAVEVGERLVGEGAVAGRPEAVAGFLAEADGELRQRTVRLTGEGGEEREWSLVWVPVPGSGEPAALLVVEDATEVLRGQRLEAWAEMARIIAHEIKNPLTPIRLNAEHVLEVWSNDKEHFNQVFERCVKNILQQVDELQQIASEFSTYSSILRIERRPDDLVDAMEELVAPYLTAPRGAASVRFEASVAELPARFDRRLLSRAARNLLENALRASGGEGEVILRVDAVDGTARIAVADRGPGVEPALLHRIFDPYFSTHDTGTGLGLPIARRVVEEHGGTIAAQNRPEGGLEVVILLPLA